MSTIFEVRPAGSDHVARVMAGMTSASSVHVRIYARQESGRPEPMTAQPSTNLFWPSVSATGGTPSAASDAVVHADETGPDTASVPFRQVLRTLDDPRYALATPITLWIDLDEAGYLVYDEENLTYGLGSTIESAVAGYRRSLIVDFELLRKDREALAQPLLARLRSLEHHIRTQG